jgi:hypothetical protein
MGDIVKYKEGKIKPIVKKRLRLRPRPRRDLRPRPRRDMIGLSPEREKV